MIKPPFGWLGPLAAAAFALLAAPPAFAQGSGKFERTQLARSPPPAAVAPPADPLIRELMRNSEIGSVLNFRAADLK